ncbi:hypothetical protein QBC43DRAFT_329341 [Cladorrhinum sp. PSN259]|nr:hypothetical protein QBC43DRAFT_329341 [Cladorrhinum sp. PSN259]
MAYPGAASASASNLDPVLMSGYFCSPESSPTTTASPSGVDKFSSCSFLRCSFSSESESDGAGADAVAEKPLVPSSAADWEAKKDIIYKLYMEDNIILNDVIQVMLEKHKFKATARMYKGQFSKWKWTKYNKSGNGSTTKTLKSRVSKKRGFISGASTVHVTAHHDSPAASASTKCITTPDGHSMSLKPRRHPHQQQQVIQSQRPTTKPHLFRLFNMSPDRFKYESALQAYRNLVATWSGPEHESPWRITSPSNPPSSQLSSLSLQPSLSSSSILQQIRTALDHFRAGSHLQGGFIIRNAFLRIESAIKCHPSATLNVEVIWDICLAVPQLILALGYHDILVYFTSHVAQFTAIQLSPSHPITRISHTLSCLAQAIRDSQSQEARYHLEHYILQGWNFWLDLASAQRGAHDHVTIHLRRGYAVLIEDFEPQTDTPLPAMIEPWPGCGITRPRAGSNFMADFETSLRESFRARGMVRTMARILELEELLNRMYLPLFVTKRKAERAKILLGAVVQRNVAKFCSRFEFEVPSPLEDEDYYMDDKSRVDEDMDTDMDWDKNKNEWDKEMVSSFHGRYLVFSARYFMASIAGNMGDQEEARELRRQSLDMGDDVKKERDLFWMQTALVVVQGLRGEGKGEEARPIEDEMRRCGWVGIRTLPRKGEEGGEVVPVVERQPSEFDQDDDDGDGMNELTELDDDGDDQDEVEDEGNDYDYDYDD